MEDQANETTQVSEESSEANAASKEAQAGKASKSNPPATGSTDSKESEASDSEEFEVVRSANREWKLPKDAANTFKHLEKSYRNATKELAAIKKKAILEEDPDKIIEQALSKKGVKLSQYAEEVLQRHLEELEKTPEQLELEQYRQDKANREKKEAEAKQAAEKEEAAKLNAYVRKELDTEIAKAMQASDLVPSASTAKHMAAVIVDSMQMYQKGKIDRILTATEAADIVKEEQNSTWRYNVQKLSPEKVFEILGEAKFNELKQWELTRLQEKASKAGLVKKPFGNSHRESSQSAGKTKRYLSEQEYRQLYED